MSNKYAFIFIYDFSIYQSILVYIQKTTAMLLSKKKEMLNSTKSSTFQQIDFNSILRDSITKARQRYSTSQNYYLTNSINKAVTNKKCRLKTFLVDEQSNKVEEHLQKYSKLSGFLTEMGELAEYYKYYTQTSIIYQPRFFRLMHHHREKKKMIEYNKLKLLLNLSDSSQEPSQNNKNYTPVSSFDLLSKLSISSKKIDEESFMIANILSRMEKQFGPTRHKTIEEVDNSFIFTKKPTNLLFTQNGPTYPKMKAIKREKEGNQSRVLKGKIKRNNSNLVYIQNQHKGLTFKLKLSKKKHQSMDNFQTYTFQKNYTSKQNKKPLKVTNPTRIRKQPQKRLSQQKISFTDIKQTIYSMKQKIKQEKKILKKKITIQTNQSEVMRHIRKVTTLQSPKEKNKVRKYQDYNF